MFRLRLRNLFGGLPVKPHAARTRHRGQQRRGLAHFAHGFGKGRRKTAKRGGAVCSPREIKATRAACGPDFKLVVPGIRPDWAAAGDQKRITTPAQAIRDGADYIVIGRPITGADDPLAAAKRIADELAGL